MRYILPVLLFLCCASVQAQNRAPAAPPTPQHTLSLTVGGGLQNLGYSGQLAMGWAARPDTWLELEGRLSQELLPWEQDSLSLVARGRQLLGESFYLQAGLLLRHQELRAATAVSAAPQSEPELLRNKTVDLALELGLGQLWRWGLFSLQVTWISYEQPVLPLWTNSVYLEPEGQRSSRDKLPGTAYWVGDLRLCQLALGVQL